ncbi:unnamed protein product [Protopolystoma xenopodis]|uniref:Uncharacterized protein n=1 Tax=Protopolystoma xenopodis TaxID=117903 RepID=A0A3S5ABJ7_9PLAT|nr:unnamed protein product [Protopolystoma xenopodis]
MGLAVDVPVEGGLATLCRLSMQISFRPPLLGQTAQLLPRETCLLLLPAVSTSLSSRPLFSRLYHDPA